MARKVVTYKLQLDEQATRIAETVAAMLEAQGRPSDIDRIVSNAVRIGYGDRVAALVEHTKGFDIDDYAPTRGVRG